MIREDAVRSVIQGQVCRIILSDNFENDNSEYT